MSTSAVSSVSGQSTESTTTTDAYSKLDLNAFIELLVTELQNQDPLNPMDSQEILQQVTQIREIASNSQLNDTLESVLLGQNVSTASSLLGRSIVALSDESKKVSGQVDRVSIKDGVPKLHVGDHVIDLKNVSEILPENSDNTQDETA